MTTNYALLSTVLTVALTLPLLGQHNHGDMPRTDKKKHDMSSMMGKPTVDETVEGLHMKVWLMTQKQHKKMMKGKMGQMMMHSEKEGPMGRMGMKDTCMGMNRAMMDSMMAGTHHIILEVTDAALGKEIDNASAKVLIVSPSKYTATVDLKPMMGHFGGALTFDEKGKYVIAVSVNVGGVSKTKEFQYAVK